MKMNDVIKVVHKHEYVCIIFVMSLVALSQGTVD